MTAVSMYSYSYALRSEEGRSLSSSLESLPTSISFDSFRPDMSGLPFNYLPSGRHPNLAPAPPRSLSVSSASSFLSSSSQPTSASQAVHSPSDEMELVSRAYSPGPSYNQPGFYASSQHGPVMPSPSQLLGGMYGPPRPVATPRSVSQRINRDSSAFGSPVTFQASPLSQPYNMPYRPPLPSQYTNPYPMSMYNRYPTAHPAGPMYVAPKVEYQFPPDLMVKVRPETLNTIVTHLNWSSWVKSRQPRSRWLPPEVISRLIRYLDYTRLVRLSSVNKDLFYNDELKTTIENRPEIEKSGCVALAEKLFKQHFPGKKGKDPCPGNLGCYYCFKVLPYDRFEHLSWNIAPKNPKSEHDDLDEENEAGFHTPSPLPKHRQASVASVTSSFPSSSLLLESTSPTMTGITKSSRQSSVALSSPLSSSYDSPRHSTTSSPPIGKLQTPAPYGPSASMASPPDVCLETAKKSSKAGKKRSRPITDDEEAHYALQRVKKHQEKRRFCIECGAKNRFYEPGDLIQPNSVDNGKAKTQHNTLWICGCYRLHSQLTYPTCYDCGRSARYSYAK